MFSYGAETENFIMAKLFESITTSLDQMPFPIPTTPAHPLTTEGIEIFERIQGVSELVESSTSGQQGRTRVRMALPFLVEIFPLDNRGKLLKKESCVVVGKDLSQRGIGFFHKEVIPYKKIRVLFTMPGEVQIEADVDLTWCRYTDLDWYESGGRILKDQLKTKSPIRP